MTGSEQALSDRLDQLGQILDRIKGIRARSDKGRAKDLVALRRELSTTIFSIGVIVRPLLKNEPEASQTFGRLYSQLLSSVALHQANWPAVRLTEASVDYQSSASRVDEACADLSRWLRNQFRDQS